MHAYIHVHTITHAHVLEISNYLQQSLFPIALKKSDLGKRQVTLQCK
jgi:hypothetical protein